MSTLPIPSDEDKDELLQFCRYGEIQDVQEFVKKFGPGPLADIRDANRNTVLHMICGNGHTGESQSVPVQSLYTNLIHNRCYLDVLDFMAPILPPSLLSAQNNSQSTALHWAAINQHLSIMKKLVEIPGGPGVDLIDIKNEAGRSALGEAEIAGWQEGAQWLVQVMKLDVDGVKEDDEDELAESSQDIEVEIEDADGQVAKMKISGGGKSEDDKLTVSS